MIIDILWQIAFWSSILIVGAILNEWTRRKKF